MAVRKQQRGFLPDVGLAEIVDEVIFLDPDSCCFIGFSNLGSDFSGEFPELTFQVSDPNLTRVSVDDGGEGIGSHRQLPMPRWPR
jgi:hypothetical protein